MRAYFILTLVLTLFISACGKDEGPMSFGLQQSENALDAEPCSQVIAIKKVYLKVTEDFRKHHPEGIVKMTSNNTLQAISQEDPNGDTSSPVINFVFVIESNTGRYIYTASINSTNCILNGYWAQPAYNVSPDGNQIK